MKVSFLNKIGITAKRITFNRNFDKLIFINDGNKNDDEYIDSKIFKHIVFYYDSDSSNFKVFGIN